MTQCLMERLVVVVAGRESDKMGGSALCVGSNRFLVYCAHVKGVVVTGVPQDRGILIVYLCLRT